MANKKTKSAAELQQAAEKLAEELKKLRLEARKAAAQEEAERKQAERQREIDEAIELGRLSRDVMIGDITVEEYLRASDDERNEIVCSDDSGIMREYQAMLEFLQRKRTSNAGVQFSYMENFRREHPDVFNG